MMKFSKGTKQLSFPIDVACAVIRQGRKILISKRHEKDHLGGLWEFPGGKRLGGESLAACLERELYEELGIRIRPVRFLRRIDHRYPVKTVSLYFYECEFLGGNPRPHRCQEFRWVSPFELRRYEFPPADEAILRELERT
jgi:mutator protein MutT